MGRPENQYLRQQTEKSLRDLERLSLQWDIIKPTKYKHRQRFYDTHDEAIGQFIPRTTRQYFCLKTLLTSTSKPVATTTSGEKISRAGKEFFNSAARLNLRFYELIRNINGGLKQ